MNLKLIAGACAIIACATAFIHSSDTNAQSREKTAELECSKLGLSFGNTINPDGSFNHHQQDINSMYAICVHKKMGEQPDPAVKVSDEYAMKHYAGVKGYEIYFK